MQAFNPTVMKTILTDLLHIMEIGNSSEPLQPPTVSDNFIRLQDTVQGSFYNVTFKDTTTGKTFNCNFTLKGNLGSLLVPATVYYDGEHAVKLENISGNYYKLYLWDVVNNQSVTMNIADTSTDLYGIRYTPAY